MMLEQLNRLENSVPQKELRNNTTEEGREGEKSVTLQKSSIVQMKGWIIPSFTLKNLLSDSGLFDNKAHSHPGFSTAPPPTQGHPFLFFIPPLQTHTPGLVSSPSTSGQHFLGPTLTHTT